MVRPVLAMLLLSATAHAGSGLPSHMGMYPTGAKTQPLAMLDSFVEVSVRGPIVETVVRQTYRNDTDHVTEATYIFPLPADAAVSAMRIVDGSRTIVAKIAPRAEAQRRYEEAVAAGQSAGLLDQERPDVFTQTVAAIPAHGTVTVELRYDCAASYREGAWELALPLVVAPRWVPGSTSGRPVTGSGRSPDTDRAPDASRITPGGSPGAGGSTSVKVVFADAVDNVQSPSHEISINGRELTFADPHSDHDAILRWHAPNAAGWTEQDKDGNYAAVIVSMPAATTHKQLAATLILDRSATTRGDADAVEHPLIHAITGAMTGGDRLAVIGSDRVAANSGPDVKRALDEAWVHAAGRFDLTKVLAEARGAASYLLVTDGLVADDAAAIAAAVKLGAPVHAIGVGPAPNRGLLRAIALRTGGTVRFAQPDDDLAALARDVLADVATPPEPLTVNWGALAASEVVPGSLPRVGAGQALLVVAKVKSAAVANARTNGDVFAFQPLGAPRPRDGETSPHGALARRWARDRLDELLADPKAALAHALHYGLVSPLTSMVAVGSDTVIQGGVKRSIAVPVSVPAGMHWQEVHKDLAKDARKQEEREEKPAGDVAKNLEAPKAHHPTPTSTATVKKPPTEAVPAQPAPPPVMTGRNVDGAPPPPADDAEAGEDRNYKAKRADVAAREYDEVLTEGVAMTSSYQPRLHFAFGLGVGSSILHSDVDLNTSLSLRLQYRNYGAELIGGLVAGDHGELRGLATYGFRLVGPLDLRLGLGGQFGHGGAGPSFSTTFSFQQTWGLPLSIFLRADLSLLLSNGTSAVENQQTLGLEWRF